MCDPLSIAGAAISVAGSLASMSAQNQATKRSEAATRREIERQRGYQRASQEALAKSKQKFTAENQTEELAAEGNKRGGELKAATQSKSEYATGGGAPTVVKGEIARKLNEALRFGTQQAGALGKMTAWNGVRMDNGMALDDSRATIGMNADFSRRSQEISDLEKATIAREGSGSTFGDILSAVGSVAGMAGSAGIGPGFGDLFGGAKVLTGAGGKLTGGGVTAGFKPPAGGSIWKGWF